MKIRVTAEQLRTLKGLGLNEIQATLYLTSLQHGIVSFKEEIAVWIESPILSQSYRLMFDTLWKQANGFKS